jgi:hypothetical protein
MLTISRAIACGFLLLSPCVFGQSSPLERRASDFDSKGIGLTETLLKFSHQEHLSLALEYIDRASMDQPIDVDLRSKTIRQALDSILLHGNGYGWRLRNGIIEVTNSHASKRSEGLLNRVIPVFKISEGAASTVKMTSAMLWLNLQMELDPSLKERGIGGDMPGNSSSVKPATLRNQTVREILSYIVLNSQAEGWVVAGPPKCLGYTPYCGLWYFIEGEPFGTSYQVVLREVRENL